jgi:hypothetical protein
MKPSFNKEDQIRTESILNKLTNGKLAKEDIILPKLDKVRFPYLPLGT